VVDEARARPDTRRLWEEHLAPWFDQWAHAKWAAAEPYWGMWHIPQSQLPFLPADLSGATAVEIGCGSAYVSAWLVRRGARPTGIDISPRQLATARRFQDEFDLHFPLVRGDAERIPLATARADLVVSEYGASAWCDPYRWIPEAARVLRPGGRLVFMAESMLARLCLPEQGPMSDRLARDLHGLHRVLRRGTSGRQWEQFALSHGNMIRLLGRCGLVVEDLIEVEIPPGATTNFPTFPDGWVERWPPEEVWFARRR
jgi:SAM-dependent methyltransferase